MLGCAQVVRTTENMKVARNIISTHQLNEETTPTGEEAQWVSNAV